MPSSHVKKCNKQKFSNDGFINVYYKCLWDRGQIAPLILREFKQINEILSPLKSSENNRFPDEFRGNESYLIRVNSLNNSK